MRKSYLVLILCALAITIVLLLTACSKAGPKGATGPAGPQGPAGQQGTPGPAGSQLFEGSGLPGVALGNVGDFYINEQTDSLYGPKTLSGWGTAISLRGAGGPAGQTGPQGAPGTANVIYYNWTAFSETNWGDFDPINSYLYRIVLIPGGVLGTSVDPHTLTYNEVCKKFGIQP